MSQTEASLNSAATNAVATHIDSWRKIGFATAHADRKRAEAAIKSAYLTVRLRPPQSIVWVDSPFKGAIAAALMAKQSPTCYDSIIRGFRDSFSRYFWNTIEKHSSANWLKNLEPQMSKAINSSYGAIHNQVKQAFFAQMTGNNGPRTTLESIGIVNEQLAPRAMLDELLDDLSGQIPYQYLPGLRKESDNGLTSRLANSAVSQTWHCGLGSMDPDLPFFDFCRSTGVNLKELEPHMEMARTAGWWWPLQEVCIVSDRPRFISVDREGRLHSNRGVSIEYWDSWSIYAWHGAFVPPRFIRWTHKRTIDGIMTEPNVEIRRMMIELIGYEAFMKGAGARKIQEDECGVLYIQELPDDEPIVTVCVINSTPEPDGHFKRYFLRVPPDIRTARQAVAWTFGLNSGEYRPLKET